MYGRRTSFFVYVFVKAKTKYAAIFRGGEQNAYLQVVQLDEWDFDSASVSTDLLDTLRAASTETHAIYDVDSRASPDVSTRHAFHVQHQLEQKDLPSYIL